MGKCTHVLYRFDIIICALCVLVHMQTHMELIMCAHQQFGSKGRYTWPWYQWLIRTWHNTGHDWCRNFCACLRMLQIANPPFPEYKKVTPDHGSGFSDAVNWLTWSDNFLWGSAAFKHIFFSAIAHCHCAGWYKHGCLFSRTFCCFPFMFQYLPVAANTQMCFANRFCKLCVEPASGQASSSSRICCFSSSKMFGQWLLR